jgi:probable phosphomutase (TIGR03848 family)
MRTLILLRHGRTDANTAGILAGDTPAALDEVGEQQARVVGERLAAVRFGWVVSSPLQRCRQTLSLALPDVSPAIEEGLTECGYGEWAGRKLSDLIQEPQWPAIQAHPSAVTFPGGESMAVRAVAAVRRWNEVVGPEGVWLACTHGDIIKAIVADALGMHLDSFQRIHVAPGSLTVIKYTPVRPFLMRLSDDGPLAVQPASTSSDAAVGGGAE